MEDPPHVHENENNERSDVETSSDMVDTIRSLMVELHN
jgi:hypothetical protein